MLGAAVIGMERIARWIGRCAIYEKLYFSIEFDIRDVARRAINDLHDALIALYTIILRVLGRLIKVFNGTNPPLPSLGKGMNVGLD